MRRARSWDSSAPHRIAIWQAGDDGDLVERHAVGTLPTYFMANSMTVFVDCGTLAISRVFSGGGANSLCSLEPAN